MARHSYMLTNAEGGVSVLGTFDTTINTDGGALALKYGLTADELTRVRQGRLVWDWFMDALQQARLWSASLTATLDEMTSGALRGAPEPLPGGPTLPPVPVLLPGPPSVPAQPEPGFFGFFSHVVAGIKAQTNYEVANGKLPGIEGGVTPRPDPALTVPVVHAELFTSGHPELTCVKGVFQGYDVYLTRPGQARRLIGFSTARRYNVPEPLPVLGTAEVWVFEVQYRYQNAPFGQFSQPLNVTVRG